VEWDPKCDVFSSKDLKENNGKIKCFLVLGILISGHLISIQCEYYSVLWRDMVNEY